MDNSPIARRRTILKLLAGSIVGSGLNGLRPHLALATAPIQVKDEVICLEFDEKLYTRVLLRREMNFEPLTEFDASETIRLADGTHIDNFRFQNSLADVVDDIHGRGRRTIVYGIASNGLEKRISILLYHEFPGFALLKITYRNMGTEPMSIERWVNGAHVLKPVRGGALEYWSFSGGSYADRRDWVQPLYDGFDQRNFMGMNASDYGGGTPILDVWRRDGGLAVGHIETVPKLVGLPLTVTKSGARVAVERNQTFTLHRGETFSTLETFVAVHHGDYFRTLDAYRRILGKRGMEQAKVPAAAYDPIWCGWGYERDYTVNQVLGTLAKASEIGLIWAVPDDGWQTALGDWYLHPKKFPRGDADMIALVKAIKDQGMKPRLWIAPLAAEPGTDLLRNHADLLLLDKIGASQDVTGWNSLYLCPAYSGTVERSKALVRKVMGDWGYVGLKIDGQHLNGVAPCYNRAHAHASPEESIEKLQDLYKAMYEEAIAINPEAVIEICPCGTSYAFHNMPYMNQAVASDPLSSWQVRHKGKAIKALMGPSAAYAGDHVELSDGANDFASTIGIGAVVSTKFTWPQDPESQNEFVLTAHKETEWRQWIALYNQKRLAEGCYRGDVYDIGFDKPEAHLITKDGRYYYAFYADRWNGPIELRGLGSGRYTVTDYWAGKNIGSASASQNRLSVSFRHFLLLEVTPLDRT